METPPSGSSESTSSEFVSISEKSGKPSSKERAVVSFVEHGLLPFLRRERQTLLLRTVGAAVSKGKVAPLGRIPERFRAELLEAVERMIDSDRRSVAPNVVVTLVSAVFPIATSDDAFGRWRTSPAR